MSAGLILAPLRGVTVRCFRETFADLLAEAGFTEAITPFITATAGYDPLKDRELQSSNRRIVESSDAQLSVTPQFIGKDPGALAAALRRVKDAGYETADLNCGCPYPMVRNKGRGSGLLKTPDLFEKMLAAGCAVMGAGKFSVKARLGVDRADELLALMPIVNRYPLRFLTVHARTARQMYDGACDWDAFAKIAAAAKVPIVANGDLPLEGDGRRETGDRARGVRRMVGRAFVRALGEREDSAALLARYVDASFAEFGCDAPVVGRIKELVGYWRETPRWKRRWNVLKLCRTSAEIRQVIGF